MKTTQFGKLPPPTRRFGLNFSQAQTWLPVVRCVPLAFFVLLGDAFASTIHASASFSSSSEPAVEEISIDANRAKRSVRGNWYDNKNQTYLKPVLPDYQDHPVRTEGHIAPPKQKWSGWNWNVSGPWTQALSYTVLTILGLGLLTLLIWMLMHVAPGVFRRKSVQAIEIDQAKVEDLPFEVHNADGDLLSHARRLADHGQYGQAIIYLYGYALLALDQSQKIYLQKGKTNRMYLRELTPYRRLEQIVETIMSKFESVHFGKRSLSKESFEHSWNELNEFHVLIHASPAHEPASVDRPIVAEVQP